MNKGDKEHLLDYQRDPSEWTAEMFEPKDLVIITVEGVDLRGVELSNRIGAEPEFIIDLADKLKSKGFTGSKQKSIDTETEIPRVGKVVEDRRKGGLKLINISYSIFNPGDKLVREADHQKRLDEAVQTGLSNGRWIERQSITELIKDKLGGLNEGKEGNGHKAQAYKELLNEIEELDNQNSDDL